MICKCGHYLSRHFHGYHRCWGCWDCGCLGFTEADSAQTDVRPCKEGAVTSGATRDTEKGKPDNDKIVHPCGASSSRVPPYDQIPSAALQKLAERFALGERKHGRDNWRKGLGDRAYALERIAHIVNHAYRLIDKLEGRLPDDGDDDAGAILWGGAFLSVAVPALKEK